MNYQQFDDQIREIENELSHIGSCSMHGKTQEEIAHIDERFFLAVFELNQLKKRRDKPEGF
ncbi:hypothetical protein [Acinetobacter brisouii]|uniref:hypothetical protein n=1 Tax=Acinetobacter brisouii TaxID=396323 RepID=UPI0003A08211|nr:hypothetical protein [Acinetobacter brisouii]